MHIFRGSPLFQATCNIKQLVQFILCQLDVQRLVEGSLRTDQGHAKCYEPTVVMPRSRGIKLEFTCT